MHIPGYGNHSTCSEENNWQVYQSVKQEAPGTKTSWGLPAIYSKILPYINSNNRSMQNMTAFYKNFINYSYIFVFWVKMGINACAVKKQATENKKHSTIIVSHPHMINNHLHS